MYESQSAELKETIISNRYINTSNKKIDQRWNSLKRLYSPEDVKKLQANVLDFQVPLYNLSPRSDHSSICRERSLLIAPGLASKYAVAKVGDSSQSFAPQSIHLIK